MLLGLEISTGRLVLRIMAGVLLAALLFLLLSFLPMEAQGILSEFLPPELSAITDMIAGLIHPALPFVGAVVAILSLLLVVLRGSMVYGPATIAFGATYLLYILLAFSFGAPSLVFPEEEIVQALQQFLKMSTPISVDLVAYADLTGLMLILMVPYKLTVIKGIILTLTFRRVPHHE